jgi:curved DNA-binding protein CbpA
MKSFRDQNFYELLEVPVNASIEDVRSAYDHAAELYASDSMALYSLVEPQQATELRDRLDQAFRVLTEPTQRAAYDRSLGFPVVQFQGGLPVPSVVEIRAELETPPEVGFRRNTEAPDGAESTQAVVETRAEMEVSEPVVTAAPTVDAPGDPATAPSTTPPVGANPEVPATESVAEDVAPSAPAADAGPGSLARVRELRPRAPEIGPHTEFNGEVLRQLREARGLSLQTVADRTRISRSHLENVEADRYQHLPPTVYLRGMLTSMARELKVDPSWVCKSYLALADAHGQKR